MAVLLISLMLQPSAGMKDNLEFMDGEFMRVLVVDDTTFMRSTIRRVLEKNGFSNVYEAVNGRDAVNKYKTIRPEFVIMDISMPVMNGIDAVVEIKKWDPEANVIICSLQGQRDNVMLAIKAGAKSFLVKPIKEEKLLNEIKKLKLETRAEQSVDEEELEKMKESMEALKSSVDHMRGIEEGYLECKREIVTNMLRLGLDLETICNCAELSEEEVQSYGEEYGLIQVSSEFKI